MFDVLAPVKRGEPLLDGFNELSLMLQILGEDFPYQFIPAAAYIGSQSGELGFLFGREVYFHRLQRKHRKRKCQVSLPKQLLNDAALHQCSPDRAVQECCVTGSNVHRKPDRFCWYGIRYGDQQDHHHSLPRSG